MCRGTSQTVLLPPSASTPVMSLLLPSSSTRTGAWFRLTFLLRANDYYVFRRAILDRKNRKATSTDVEMVDVRASRLFDCAAQTDLFFLVMVGRSLSLFTIPKPSCTYASLLCHCRHVMPFLQVLAWYRSLMGRYM